jgi:hypothetical protein
MKNNYSTSKTSAMLEKTFAFKQIKLFISSNFSEMNRMIQKAGYMLACVVALLFSYETAAQTTVDIPTTNAEHFTGWIYASGGLKSNGDIQTNYNGTATSRKFGYVKFDLSSIPAGATITAVRCSLSISAVGTNADNIEIRNMGSTDPVTALQSIISSAITAASNQVYSAGWSNSTGWKNLTLNSTGVSAVQSGLSQGWVAFGIRKNTTGNIAQWTISGHTQETLRPILTVTYTGGTPPTITSFTPATACEGDIVTLTGTGFGIGGSVTVGGVSAGHTWNSLTPNNLVVTIPAGAATGPIAYTRGGLTGTSASNLTITNNCTMYWVGGSSGNLNGANVWSETLGGPGVGTLTPAVGRTFIFDGTDISSSAGNQTGAVTANMAAATSMGRVIFQNGAVVTLTGTSALSLTAGRTLITASLAGDDISIDATSSLTVGTNATLALAHTSDASNRNTFNNAGTLTINAGRTFNLSSAWWHSNTGLIDVYGTLNIGTSSDIMTKLENSGTLKLQNGSTLNNTHTNNHLIHAGSGIFEIVNNPNAIASALIISFTQNSKLLYTGTTARNVGAEWPVAGVGTGGANLANASLSTYPSSLNDGSMTANTASPTASGTSGRFIRQHAVGNILLDNLNNPIGTIASITTGTTMDFTTNALVNMNGTYYTYQAPFNVEINKPGASVTLLQSPTLNNTFGEYRLKGTLTLTSGNINLGNQNLTIESTGSISGGSASSFVNTDDTGRLIQPVSSTLISYPVGNGSDYMPVSFTSAALLSYRVGIKTPSATLPAESLLTKVWEITTVSGTSTIAPRFTWNASVDNGVDPANKLYRFNGGSWADHATFVNSPAQYQANYSGVSCCGEFSPYKGISTFTWTGIVNSSWSEPGNWSPGIPVTGSDVLIPTTLPPGAQASPTISGVTPTVGNIEIEASRVLTIATNGALTVNGVLTNNATLTVQSGGALVQAVGSTNAGTGTYNVQRQIPAGPNNAFRFMGSPISDISATNIIGVSASGSSNGGQVTPLSNCSPSFVAAGSPYGNILELRENPAEVLFNCAQSLWFVKSAGSLENGRGYAMKANGGQTITFSGAQINNGSKTVTGLTRQSGLITDHVSDEIGRGWHMLSNPYPSPIRITQAKLESSGLAETNLHRWNSATQSWVPIGPGDFPVTIAVGQAFQVRKFIEGGNTSFEFTNDMRFPDVGVQFFDQTYWNDYLLNVKISGNSFTDETTIFFNPDATPAFDSKWDSNKLLNSPERPAIFTLVGTERMAYNGLPLLNQPTIVPMALYPGTSGTYTLDFSELETLPSTAMVYLEDKKTGIWTNVRAQNAYTFTSVTSDNIQRFNIHFEPPVNITKENAVCSNEGFISISNPSNENWTYVLTKNSLELSTGTLSNTETLIESLTSGVYTLKLNNANYSVEEELVIQADGSLQSFIEAMEESYYIHDQIEAKVHHPNEGTEYRWFINDLFAGVGLALNVTITDPGSYQLRLEANKGICNSTSYYDFNVDAPLTISNIMQNYGLRAYPNPANELVNLVWNDDIQQVNQVIIYDISGREIRRQNVSQQVKGNQLSLDVSDLKVGIYLITIEGKDIRKTVNVSIVH